MKLPTRCALVVTFALLAAGVAGAAETPPDPACLNLALSEAPAPSLEVVPTGAEAVAERPADAEPEVHALACIDSDVPCSSVPNCSYVCQGCVCHLWTQTCVYCP